MRAEKILQDRLFQQVEAGPIRICWDHVVQDIVGTPERGVTGVTLRHVRTQATQDLVVSGVFVAIGHAPNTQLFEG